MKAMLIWLTIWLVVPESNQLNLDEKPLKDEKRYCEKKDKSLGVCARFTQCLESNLTIATGGIIHDSEVRIGEHKIVQCASAEWCCAIPSTSSVHIPNRCVTLHNTTGTCVDDKYCPEKKILYPHGFVDDEDERSGGCVGSTWCCENPVTPAPPTTKEPPVTQSPVTVTVTPVTVSVPPVTESTTKKQSSTPTSFDETTVPASCITRDNRPGKCIRYTQCTDDLSIAYGGVIGPDSERVGGCVGDAIWCCAEKNSTRINKPTVETVGCTVDTKNECPWCVAVYRIGGNPRQATKSGRFCGGVLIGKRFILTAATCILSSRNLDMWVQAPSSPTPERKYSVGNRIMSPDYNSGTSESDYGFLTLDEDLQWQEKTDQMGACIGLQTPLIDTCYTVGFDSEDKIEVSKVTVKKGSCTSRGNTIDAACGTAVGDCKSSYGSPVLCSSDNGGLVVAGVARGYCKNNAAVLGSILYAKNWINDLLSKSNLNDHDYKIV